MRFEVLVQTAVRSLEEWNGVTLTPITEISILYEELAERAPAELAELASLPKKEGRALWSKLTALGVTATAALLALAARADVAYDDWKKIEAATRRMRASTSALIRLSVDRARGAREVARV